MGPHLGRNLCPHRGPHGLLMGRHCSQQAPHGPLGPLMAGIPPNSLHMGPLGPYGVVFSKPCCSVCCIASQGRFSPRKPLLAIFSKPCCSVCYIASQGRFCFPQKTRFLDFQASQGLEFAIPGLPGAGIWHSRPPRGWNLAFQASQGLEFAKPCCYVCGVASQGRFFSPRKPLMVRKWPPRGPHGPPWGGIAKPSRAASGPSKTCPDFCILVICGSTNA